jgi:UDP-glucuronate decarboxylase
MSVILVTGGAGFIGSHLCRRLTELGERVICADNLFTGREENVAGLSASPGFEFIKHDVTEPLTLDCDRIYNLACPASPVHYQSDAIKTMKTNILGVMNMLELAKRAGARILQASTSEVYGDPAVHPQVETYWGNVNPTGVRACYDEGKRAAEALCFDYHRQMGVDIKLARIFNTYGPYMSPDDGRVVSNFIVQALAGREITVYGGGGQTRSFCYIDDLVDVLIRLMESEDGFTGPCNAGNPCEFTVLELARKVIELTGSEQGVRFEPLPRDDPKRRRPDISLAKEKLGWEPKVALEEGLKKTIEYFRGMRTG